MTAVVVFLVLLVLAALVAIAFYVMRSRGGLVVGVPAAGPDPGVATRIRPTVADFHVRGDAAHVRFTVPLAEGPVDPHLRTVLEHEAVAVLREKRDHGLPIDDVRVVVVYASRDGEAAEVGRVDLPEAGALPEVAAPDLLPHDRVAGFDPLARLDEAELDVVPGVAVREGEGPLTPVAAAVELPGTLEVALRAQGIDPTRITLPQLVLGLLQAAGYQVTEERGLTAAAGAPLYTARRAGSSTLVAVVEHGQGEHPELSEQVINEMVVRTGQGGGFLVTDKYGPYMMYDKERRSRVRFITRERLQAFVDSFALRS